MSQRRPWFAFSDFKTWLPYGRTNGNEAAYQSIVDDFKSSASLDEEWKLEFSKESSSPIKGEETAKLDHSSASGSLDTIYDLRNISFYGPRFGLDSDMTKNTSQVIYGSANISFFGPRHGLATIKRKVNTGKNIEGKTVQQVATLDSNASINRTTTSTSVDAPTSCIICIEDFTPTFSPPNQITAACTHPLSVCPPRLSKSISHDLSTKLWNQIKCPECGIPLIYGDIKRLADPTTFLRYEELSFRSAVSSDSEFIWCLSPSCGFGQLHATGHSQPIVRCLKCGAKSCFKHNVAWHERLTCDDYDEMMRNPMGFKSMLEREEEMQAEEERQRQRHEAGLVKARDRQQKEADRRRDELEKKRKMEEWAKQEKERQEQKELMWKRQIDEQASLKLVERTTKRCPGCSWPIEKNEGCAHMTCTKCHHQFCWKCLGRWATHRGSC